MEERTIFRLSLIVAVIGLTFLMLYSEEVDLKSIENIEMITPEEKVKVHGIITRLTQTNNTLFLELQGQQAVITDIVVFTEEDLYLSEGDFVEVNGQVEEYQGKKEIIASKIVKK